MIVDSAILREFSWLTFLFLCRNHWCCQEAAKRKSPVEENADKQKNDEENVEGDEKIEKSGADKDNDDKESPSKKSKTSPSTPSKQGSSPNAKTINITPEVRALSEKVVAETAAANSSIVGGALVRTVPTIAKDQSDLGREAKDRIVSIIKAAKIALGPTDLEGTKPAKLTRLIKACPDVATQSITETRKQRAKVISDLEKVMEFLEHKNTFVRVTKVTSKMRKIPKYTETKTGSPPTHRTPSRNDDGSPASGPFSDAAAGTPAAAAPTAGTPAAAKSIASTPAAADGSPASSPSTDAAAGTPAAAAPTAGTPAAAAIGNDDNNADNTEK